MAQALKKVRLQQGVTLYVMWFARSGAYSVFLKCINGQTSVINVSKARGQHQVVQVTKDWVNGIVKSGVTIDAVCGSFHGAGFAFGPWKKTKRPFMTMVDFSRLVLRPLCPAMVAFCSCYQGGMTSLYEVPECVKYVIASPGFHPYVDIFALPSFGNLPPLRRLNQKSVQEYSVRLTCEWMAKARPKASYSCMKVFDISKREDLAQVAKREWKKLHFGEHSRIDKEDANLSDLWSAAYNAPDIRNAIKNFVVGTCIQNTKCHTVFGPSVERRMPKKWQTEYMATRWYRKVLAGQDGW